MSKEIRDLLEKVNEIVSCCGYKCGTARKPLNQALDLLKQPKCKTCGDKKPEIYAKWLCELRSEDRELGHTNIKRTDKQKRELYQMYVESFEPCPDCQQPLAGEFTQEIRDYIADYIYAEEHGIAMQHKPRNLEHDILEACDRLDIVETIKDELLTALENLRGFVLTEHLAEVRRKENSTCPKSCATCHLLNEAFDAMAKAKPEKKHGVEEKPTRF